MSQQSQTVRSEEKSASAIEVTFQSRGRSRREWTARIDLGSEEENGAKALDVAWKHNATIVATREVA